MAVTQIHAIETTLTKAIDYITNPGKTDEKLLVSSFGCSAETAAIEFDWTRKNADKEGGRLGYHLIQSFAPGEVDYDTAHEIGKKYADKLLKGKYEYVIATHIDRGHVHNHIIFNSVSHTDKKKFHAGSDIYRRIARESDKLCKEYGLSVIEPSKNKGKSYTEYTADKQGQSWKSKLRETIDKCVLTAKDWEEFLQLMQAEEYEIKQGKHISFRAGGQERFTRSKTLGGEYTEERIKERLQGTKTVSKAKSTETKINLLIDIENNIKAQQSAGFAHWAKINNLKMAARTMNYLTENGILDYSVLSEKYEDIKDKKNSTHTSIKEVEKRIKQLDTLIKDIEIYRKTKPVVDKLDKIVFKDKYRRENESDFILYKAAEQSLKIHFKDGKLPLIKSLRTEMNQLYSEKNKLYKEYGIYKKEFKDIQLMKSNVDMILGKSKTYERETNRSHSSSLE